jgi:hypothetical protein
MMTMSLSHMRFEVLTVLTVKIVVFWEVMLCPLQLQLEKYESPTFSNFSLL